MNEIFSCYLADQYFVLKLYVDKINSSFVTVFMLHPLNSCGSQIQLDNFKWKKIVNNNNNNNDKCHDSAPGMAFMTFNHN